MTLNKHNFRIIGNKISFICDNDGTEKKFFFKFIKQRSKTSKILFTKTVLMKKFRKVLGFRFFNKC